MVVRTLDNRLKYILRFYTLLDRLEQILGGSRMLADFSSYRDWPKRGVYLFFEPGEIRNKSEKSLRVVRIGTHALVAGSRSTLRQRLGQHRGHASGGGNHRGSIFRSLIGQALLAQGELAECRSWGVKGDAAKASAFLGIEREKLASSELPVEQAVTRYIGAMPFLWLDIADEPGPDSLRGVIECNTIALLSNYGGESIDQPSAGWLGLASDRPLVCSSGLWNQRHVGDNYDPSFLSILENMITKIEA